MKSVATSALLILCLSTEALGQCGRWQVDTAYANNGVLKRYPVGGSLEDQMQLCCRACKATPLCIGFTVALHKCALRKSMNGLVTVPGSLSVSYRRPADAPLPQVVPAEVTQCQRHNHNVDYPGNNIRNFQVTGLQASQHEQCCSACGATPTCKAYTLYNTYCYLKTAITSQVAKLAAVSAEVNKLPTSTSCTNIAINASVGGTHTNDVSKFTTAMGTNQERFTECSAACAASGACAAVVLNGTTCVLRTQLGSYLPVATRGAISANCVPPAPTSSECPNVEVNVDYPGNDIAFMMAFGNAQDLVSACCRFCQQNKQCAGFTLIKNMCNLKSAMLEPTPTPAAIAGRSLAWPAMPSCLTTERWVNYPGNDIRSVAVSGTTQDQVDDCGNACADEPSCVGYVVTNNTCFLKSKLEKQQASVSDAFVGVPFARSTICTQIQRDTDYPGNDITTIIVTGNEQLQVNSCCNSCSNRAACKGFVVFNKVCTLKSEMIPGGSKVGVISGLKK